MDVIETLPGFNVLPESATDEQIRRYISANLDTEWHSAGTVRMGREDDEMAVLRERDLRVKGTKNLHVIDCTAQPSPVGSGPFAYVTAQALRVAEIISGVSICPN